MIEYWQILGIVGVIGILISLLSYRWGHTEGQLSILAEMFEAQVEEMFKDE